MPTVLMYFRCTALWAWWLIVDLELSNVDADYPAGGTVVRELAVFLECAPAATYCDLGIKPALAMRLVS